MADPQSDLDAILQFHLHDPGLENPSESKELEDPSGRPHGVRFGEGQPRGRRPKGTPNRSTIVKRVANKRIRTSHNGVVRRVTVLQAVVDKLINLYAQGDPQAVALHDKLIGRFSFDDTPAPVAFFPMLDQLTPEEFEALAGADPFLSDEEVLEKFPHLKKMLKGWERDPAKRYSQR